MPHLFHREPVLRRRPANQVRPQRRIVEQFYRVEATTRGLLHIIDRDQAGRDDHSRNPFDRCRSFRGKHHQSHVACGHAVVRQKDARLQLPQQFVPIRHQIAQSESTHRLRRQKNAGGRNRQMRRRPVRGGIKVERARHESNSKTQLRIPDTLADAIFWENYSTARVQIAITTEHDHVPAD